MTHGAVDWYAARAAGVIAYVLLTAVVLVGLTLAGKLKTKTWPKFAVTDLHRFGSLLVGVFIGLHVLTIALDTYTPFSVTQLVVPFASSYRPVWVALGIVSTELLIAVAVTNALKSRIPYRWWRRAHFATFLVWAGSTVHGIGAGTDSALALAVHDLRRRRRVRPRRARVADPREARRAAPARRDRGRRRGRRRGDDPRRRRAAARGREAPRRRRRRAGRPAPPRSTASPARSRSRTAPPPRSSR